MLPEGWWVSTYQPEVGAAAETGEDFLVFFGAGTVFFAAEARDARAFFLTCDLRRFIFGELRRSFLPIGEHAP